MHAASATTQSATTAAQRKPPLPALTGIRSLLALAIVFFHFTPAGLRWDAHPWLSLYPIVDNGYVFVSFFFLLSGFILVYNYAGREIALTDFMAARLARLYPVYFFTLLVSIPMIVAEWHARPHAQFFEGIVLTPLMLQTLLPRIATFSNTVAWALSCEAIFYLAFPWLNRRRWPASAAMLLTLFIALWLLGMLPHALYIHFDPDHLGHMADRYSSGFWIVTLKYTPLPFFCTFLAGVVLGHLHEALKLAVRGRMIIGLCGFGAAWFFFYYLAAQTPYILIVGGLITPLFAAMMLGLAGPSPLASVFSVRPLMTLGAASYCLYILHFNVFILLHLHHVPERLGLTRFDPWVSYIFILLLALAVYRWVEQPGHKALMGWWKKRRSAN